MSEGYAKIRNNETGHVSGAINAKIAEEYVRRTKGLSLEAPEIVEVKPVIVKTVAPVKTEVKKKAVEVAAPVEVIESLKTLAPKIAESNDKDWLTGLLKDSRVTVVKLSNKRLLDLK